jgi:hypothetical protein
MIINNQLINCIISIHSSLSWQRFHYAKVNICIIHLSIYSFYVSKVSNALAAIVLRSTILKSADGIQLEAALKKCDLQAVVKVFLIMKKKKEKEGRVEEM